MIEMSFSEIHFHLLLGVDDGPCSIDSSIELARMTAADGTRTIVATPHVNGLFVPEVSSLPEQVRLLAERLRRERITMRCCAAASSLPSGSSASIRPS